MPQVILYTQPSGVAAVIHPAPEALAQYGIHAIAAKDVPAGLPYKIVDAADIPTDRSMRAAWTVHTSLLTDGVGAEANEFPAQEGGAA